MPKDQFTKWRRRVRAILRSKTIRYSIPFVVITVACHVWFHVTIGYFDIHTTEWWIERHPLIEPSIDWYQACVKSFPDKISTCVRIHSQMQISDSRAAHHFWIMRFFQVRYFSFLSTAFAAVTFAAPFIIFIGKNGWDGMKPAGRSAMLGLACNAAFFGSFPTWTRMEDNINENKILYTSHGNLSESIRTYILTKNTSEKCKKEESLYTSPPQEVFLKGGSFHIRKICQPDVFSLIVERKLAALNVIYLEADANQVSMGQQHFLELTGHESETPTSPIEIEE